MGQLGLELIEAGLLAGRRRVTERVDLLLEAGDLAIGGGNFGLQALLRIGVAGGLAGLVVVAEDGGQGVGDVSGLLRVAVFDADLDELGAIDEGDLDGFGQGVGGLGEAEALDDAIEHGAGGDELEIGAGQALVGEQGRVVSGGGAAGRLADEQGGGGLVDSVDSNFGC